MRIQRTPSLRLFVAQTLAALVRPADALTQAEACVREAERDPSLPNREALLASCRQVLEETRPAIATLALVLRGERPSDAAVTVGARVVSGALLDVPIALNPGRVAIVARASGFAPIEQTIELARGERRSLELAFERAPQSTTTTVERAITSPPPRAVTVEPRRPLPVGPIVTLSVGAVALVTGAVTFALRNGEIASCPIEGGRFVCADSTAADALVARASSAESLNTVTNIALVSGGVLLAGGAAWLVADRLVRRERAPIAVAPTVGRAQLGITAGGRF